MLAVLGAAPAGAVGTGAVTVLITSGTNPAKTGDTVTFTVTVTPVGAGVVPTGTVAIKDDGTAISGSPKTLDGSGVATITQMYSTKADHVITADYSGDGAYAAASATPKLETVDTVVLEKVWQGATDSNWSTAANWNPPLAPGMTDTVVFPDNTVPSILDANTTVAHVSFKGAGGRVLTAAGTSTLTVTGSVHDDSATGSTLNLPLATGSTQHVVDGILTLAGVVSGTGGLQTFGATTLSGLNTYTGVTDIQAGTVTVTTTPALGDTAGITTVAAGASLKVAGGVLNGEPLTLAGDGVSASVGALHLAGNNSLAGAITLTGTQATVSFAGAGTLSGVVSGASKLVKTGAGKASLTGINTYSLGTDVLAGTAATNKAAGFGTGTVALSPSTTLSVEAAVVVPNAITTAAGSTLQSTADGTRLTGPVTLGGSTSVLTNGTASLEFDNTLSGTGPLTKNGTGEAFLSGSAANVYTGATTVAAGLLDVGKINPVVGVPGAVAVSANSALALDNDNQLGDTSAVTVAATGTFDALGFSDLFGSLTSAGSTYMGIFDPDFGSSYSLVRVGALSLTGGSLFMVVGGSNPGVDQDQIRVSTSATVGGTLNVDGDVPFGTTIKLVDNTGSSPVTGTFTGLPEGATVHTDNRTATISYHGGDGNDVTLTQATARSGYWMLGSDGKVYAFGDAVNYGDTSTKATSAKPVDIEPTSDYRGYWILMSDGGLFGFGDATTHMLGNAVGRLRAGETATTISNDGFDNYWIFTSQGRAFDYGNAGFFDDMDGTPLNGPVRGSVASPSGNGYYMVASDGGIFAFGDAKYRGSMGGKPLNGPVVGLAPDPDGDGYWLVATDGGLFSFNAGFHQSMGGKHLNKPMVGMVAYGDAYLMVASDGGIFNFSNKPFQGSLGSNPPANPIVNVAPLNEG